MAMAMCNDSDEMRRDGNTSKEVGTVQRRAPTVHLNIVNIVLKNFAFILLVIDGRVF